MTATAVNKGPFFGARDLQTLLLFLCILINYAERINVSLSLIAMTGDTNTNPNFEVFPWDEKQRSYIISSFFWGYFLTQFLGGFMSGKLGVRLTLLVNTVGSSVLSMIIPLCVRYGGWQAYCALRIGQGLFQGMLFPSVHEHLAQWSPIDERSRLGGLSHTGIECGTIIAMSTTGIIAESGVGWPGVSYIFGGIGLGLCVVFSILLENSPATARFITQDERRYILASLAKPKDAVQTKIPIPWRAILTSVPFLSFMFVRTCTLWGVTTLQSEIPVYLQGVLGMDMKSNSLYSALPYLAMLVFSMLFLIVADFILRRNWATLSVIRKTVNTIAMWMPAAMLIGLGFLDEHQTALAITLMTLSVGLNGGATVGNSLNTIDLSPNHAGIVMGISNSIANLSPIVAPLVVGIVVYDETQRSQWQIVFAITAVIFFVGNLQFLFLGSTNTQKWDRHDFLVKNDVAREINEPEPERSVKEPGQLI